MMFCKNCGAQLPPNETFCTNCGAQAVMQQPQPAQQPAQQPAYYAAPKKKKHTGCLVAVIVVLLLLGAATWFILSLLGVLGPKDLGIRYTDADYASAMKKIGTQITFEGMSGQKLQDYLKAHKGEKRNITDYDWKFSNYQKKTFELTDIEATALINEIAPLFTWFDDAQVKTTADGKIEGSFKVDLKKIEKDLFSDVVGKIPPSITSVLPGTFNLYVSGPALSIKNNKADPTREFEKIDVGSIPLKPLSGEQTTAQREVIFGYVERIYTEIPGLKIASLTVNEKGNFAFTGSIPQKVVITPKAG